MSPPTKPQAPLPRRSNDFAYSSRHGEARAVKGQLQQGPLPRGSQPYYAAFIQTLHVTPTFTVRGLALDIFGGKTERHNRLSIRSKAQGSSNGVSFTGGEVFSSSGHRSPLQQHEGLRTSTRFAWQPSKESSPRWCRLLLWPDAQMSPA